MNSLPRCPTCDQVYMHHLEYMYVCPSGHNWRLTFDAPPKEAQLSEYMNRYYSEEGEFLGRAWSTAIRCDDSADHKPHAHTPEFTSYGPYMCSGVPERALYNTPDRKPVN